MDETTRPHVEVGQAERNALRAGAAILRSGAEIPEHARHLLADLLESESAVMGEIVNFAELFGATIKQASGGQARLQVLRNEETGDVKFLGNNSSNAVRFAKALLNHQAKALPGDGHSKRDQVVEALYVRENLPVDPEDSLKDWRSKPSQQGEREYTRGRLDITASYVMEAMLEPTPPMVAAMQAAWAQHVPTLGGSAQPRCSCGWEGESQARHRLQVAYSAGIEMAMKAGPLGGGAPEAAEA